MKISPLIKQSWKTNLGTVLPLEVDWSDIGSWDSLWENESKDINGNVVSGKVLIQNSKNCYLKSENKLLVSIGLEEIVIVETQDATLVANKKFSQQVKEIVQKLNQRIFLKQNSIKKFIDLGDILCQSKD